MNHLRLIRVPVLSERTARSVATNYRDIAAGLMTKGVRFGRTVAWPEHEIDAVVQARIAGATEAELRQLVADLHEARKAPIATRIETARSAA